MVTKTHLDIEILTYEYNGLSQEAIMVFPKNNPSPGVIFIHGHKGNSYTSLFIGKKLLEQGYAIFLPTMMGYGNSLGNLDFCGPQTIGAINAGIEIFLQDSRVKKDTIGIYGISRGAMVASQMITQNIYSFSTAVLEAGAYDLEKLYSNQTTPQGVKDNMTRETSEDLSAALQSRSSIFQAKKIKTPILILHGEKDKAINIEQASMLDEKLTILRKPHELIIVENAGHHLGKKGRYDYVLPFLKRYLIAQ